MMIRNYIDGKCAEVKLVQKAAGYELNFARWVRMSDISQFQHNLAEKDGKVQFLETCIGTETGTFIRLKHPDGIDALTASLDISMQKIGFSNITSKPRVRGEISAFVPIGYGWRGVSGEDFGPESR